MNSINKKMPSDKQEKLIANFLGWHQVSGSGSRNCLPGDVESDSWLGECKTHVKPDHSILFNRYVWQKIATEAKSKFKIPILFVDDGSQTIERTWALFPYTLFDFGSTYTFNPYKYDFNSKSNISFDHSKLAKFYCDKANSEKSDFLIPIIEVRRQEYDRRELGILPLRVFKKLCGEF